MQWGLILHSFAVIATPIWPIVVGLQGLLDGTLFKSVI